MNRREFLQSLFTTTAVAYTSKLIFDMGKNSRLYTPVVNSLYTEAPYEEVIIHGNRPFIVHRYGLDNNLIQWLCGNKNNAISTGKRYVQRDGHLTEVEMYLK